jgi:hypothetical protein
VTAFDAALEDLHADEDLSVAASFRRPPYTWQACRVILSQPTDITGTAIAGKLDASIIASQITDQPQHGDELLVGTATYTVESAERDALALSWRLTLSEPTVD